MAGERTPWERLSNRLFAIPTVAQLWAKISASRTKELVEQSGAIPFAQLRKPLFHSRIALVTTAGVHLRTQTPFDMQNPDGDASAREISATIAEEQLMITHKYYDHSDADADLNVVFPLAHLRDLVNQGVLGDLAPRHFGLMGHIDGAQLPILTQRTAPAIAAKLRQDGVDCVLLTPA